MPNYGWQRINVLRKFKMNEFLNVTCVVIFTFMRIDLYISLRKKHMPETIYYNIIM